MSSNLRVDRILPSTGTEVGVGTATGSVALYGDVNVAGTLTYEDVTNIDSVGVVTARSGLHVTSGQVLVAKTTTSITTQGSRLDNGLITVSGNSNSTNLATNNGGNLSLANIDSTDNNFSNIGGYNSNGLVVSQIDFINKSHSSRTGDIAFLTHNGSVMSERLRITSAGDVGINRPNPSAALDVESVTDQTVLRLRNNGGNNTRLLFSNKAAGVAEIFYQGDFRFVDDENSDAERLRISSNGAVCIGSGYQSSGGGQLTIRGLGVNSYAVQDYQYVGTPSSNNTLSQIRFTANTSGASVIGGARIQASADADWSATGDAPTRLQFYTTPNGSASQLERLRIDSNGNIGINEISPDVLLHLTKTNADPYNTVITHLKLNNGGGNGGSGSRIELKTGAARCWIQSFIDGGNSGSGGALVFGTPSSGTLGTERLRISNDGSLYHRGNNSSTINNTDGDSQGSAGYPAGGATFNKNVSVNNNAGGFGQCMNMISHTKSITLNGSTNHNMVTIWNREGCFIGHVYAGYSTGGDGAVAMYKFNTFYGASSIIAELGPSGRSSDTISVNISSSGDSHTFRVNGNGYSGDVTIGLVFLSAGTSSNDHYGVRYY